MTRERFGAPEPASATKWHPTDDLLAGYAVGAVGEIDAWSVETHLETCANCRSAVSARVDGDRLDCNRAVLLARIAIPEGGRLWRLACRCGMPDHLLRLLTATSSLRRSWLLSVIGVLALVTGEAVLLHDLSRGSSVGVGAPGAETLVPFLLVGPLLVLAGVAAAFMPALDPSYRLAVAAPFSSLTLLLVRTVSALLAALAPVTCAAFVMPGPGWLPAALLLPSLALCAFAVAAVTVVGPVRAVATSALLWATPLLWLSVIRSPLMVVQGRSQVLCGVVLAAAVAVVFVRRDRLEMGWAQ